MTIKRSFCDMLKDCIFFEVDMHLKCYYRCLCGLLVFLLLLVDQMIIEVKPRIQFTQNCHILSKMVSITMISYYNDFNINKSSKKYPTKLRNDINKLHINIFIAYVYYYLYR